MSRVEVVFGDIFSQDVDAIVNPANSLMLYGGGLAGVVARRAGFAVVSASRAQVPVPTGKAIITGAGRLPFKAIIHAVGPVYEQRARDYTWRTNSAADTSDVDELLQRVHFSALKLAWENDLRSVAFPAVSCGVFRFPVERAAPIAVRAVRLALREYSPSVERVLFCLLDEGHYQAFANAASADS